MAQDQKRNPHRTEEGMRLRTAVGENETPKDLKTLHSEETEVHSCTRVYPQDEPGVGEPKGVISDPAEQEQRRNSNLSFKRPNAMHSLYGSVLQSSAPLLQLLDLQLVTQLSHHHLSLQVLHLGPVVKS